jgi:hypothetical protein
MPVTRTAATPGDQPSRSFPVPESGDGGMCFWRGASSFRTVLQREPHGDRTVGGFPRRLHQRDRPRGARVHGAITVAARANRRALARSKLSVLCKAVRNERDCFRTGSYVATAADSPSSSTRSFAAQSPAKGGRASRESIHG